MGETAVLATDSKVPATYHDVMRAGDMTISAICRFLQVPDIITSNFGKCTRLRDILDPGNVHPGRTTVITCNFSLIRYSLDYLVCDLFTVIAVSTISGKDKLVAHGNYWMRIGSLICCSK